VTQYIGQAHAAGQCTGRCDARRAASTAASRHAGFQRWSCCPVRRRSTIPRPRCSMPLQIHFIEQRYHQHQARVRPAKCCQALPKQRPAATKGCTSAQPEPFAGSANHDAPPGADQVADRRPCTACVAAVPGPNASRRRASASSIRAARSAAKNRPTSAFGHWQFPGEADGRCKAGVIESEAIRFPRAKPETSRKNKAKRSELNRWPRFHWPSN